VGRLIRDLIGSSLVEFTIVFPVFILVAFGTVDVSLMLYDWALANKAAYVGAHTAVLSYPVAGGITDQNDSYEQTLIGNMCYDPATGINSCPNLSANCTASASSGTCTCTSTNAGCLDFTAFDNAAFTPIFNRMQAIFPPLQRQNVTISYVTNNLDLGFVGNPGGVPMAVTVSITGRTHELYFLGGLMRFFGKAFANPPIPTFTTTLTSEDMVTN
jgi:Flp pilus assembly protein TadG